MSGLLNELETYKDVHREIAGQKAQKVDSAIGCSECGMSYSFFFRAQYHKEGCPNATESNLKAKNEGRGDD